MIWDEVGEDKFEREKVLLDIEQECVEAYRRKVDHANVSRSRLHQELAESEAELTHFLLCLGERSVPIIDNFVVILYTAGEKGRNTEGAAGFYCACTA
jgi:hypothetical protein